MGQSGGELHHYKFEVPEIIFGRGLLGRVGSCASRLGGRRVFVVSDAGLFEAGWVDTVLGSLRDSGLEAVYYDNVSPNPRDRQVEDGAREYLRLGADVVVGLGGGSAMDAAKGIALLASNGGRVQDYEGSNRIHKPLPPLVLCPTTCGTGSDVSQFAIITDTVRHCKMTIMSRTVAPDISLTDPDTLETLPEEFVCTTAADALSHAVEAFFSIAATSLTDVHAVKAVRLLSTSLVAAVRARDAKALENLSRASLHAGMAFSNSLLGIVHALAHPIGGLYDTAHGCVNAILLPEVIRYNLPAVEDKLPELAWGLGHRTDGDPDEAASIICDAVDELLEATGAPRHLSSLGVARDSLPELAERALNDACILTSPRKAAVSDLLSILERAY
ncbi:MAG: iron-containing alcohol dehydrogenase [Deltaproteobacteria bacterium]|nr:iron-containing alcohol dehydrogenase [Deltaproteobacteria bacterium]